MIYQGSPPNKYLTSASVPVVLNMDVDWVSKITIELLRLLLGESITSDNCFMSAARFLYTKDSCAQRKFDSSQNYH